MPGTLLLRALPLAAVAAATTACGTGPRPVPLIDVVPPAGWSTSPEGLEAADGGATGWLDDLDAPGLAALVAEALAHNRDLRAAAARLDAAGARTRIARAARLPALSADADAFRTESLRGESGDATVGERFELALGLAWEIDLWGRLRDLEGAAALEQLAAAADFRGSRLSLAAATARAWFNAVEATAQVGLAEATADSFRELAEILEANFARGLEDVAALDVHLAKANAAGARASLAVRRRELDAARRALEVLLGRYPDGRLRTDTALPAPGRRIPAGLPSALMARRPDIVAAEARAAAALSRNAAARKNLLPAIRLTSGTGSTSTDLDRVLDFDDLVWTIAGGLTQPVFEGGRLRAEIDESAALAAEVAARYAQTALDAFREVETSLAAESLLEGQVAALTLAADESRTAETLALAQYAKGLVDIITVLEAQRRAFDSRSALLAARNLRLQNRIDLHLALGGDFDSLPTPAPPPANGGPTSP